MFLQAIVLNEFIDNDNLPLRSTYIDNYGFDDFNKYTSCLYAGAMTVILFVVLVKAIRANKVVRAVL